MTIEEITAAINADPALKTAVVTLASGTDEGKQLITNQANILFTDRIGEETSKIYKKQDEDIFEILGIRPGTGEDGKKQKTYELQKQLYKELKTLREKGDFSKDDKVKELEAQIETLKSGNGNKEAVAAIQAQYDQSKQTWLEERKTLNEKIAELEKSGIDFRKLTAINNEISALNINPDVSESIKNMVLDSVRAQLTNEMHLEGDKFYFRDSEGKTMQDELFNPMSVKQRLNGLDAIKDIVLKDNNISGGGASQNLNGGVQTVEVEGKDLKKLNLPAGSFKTKIEFQKVAEEVLMKNGISRSNPDFTKMKDEAYKDYNVAQLPIK